MNINNSGWRTLLSCCALVLGLILVGDANADDDAEELVAIIGAIEAGWEQADGTPFRKHFLDFPGARYIESGGQNEGLTDLVELYVVRGFRTSGVLI